MTNDGRTPLRAAVSNGHEAVAHNYAVMGRGREGVDGMTNKRPGFFCEVVLQANKYFDFESGRVRAIVTDIPC